MAERMFDSWERAGIGMRRGRRPLDSDRQIEVGLNGRSRYHATQLDIHQAVEELRGLAAGREDLTGRALGTILGGFVASPGTANPWHLVGAGLLAQLLMDPAEFQAAFEQARANASRPAHNGMRGG